MKKTQLSFLLLLLVAGCTPGTTSESTDDSTSSITTSPISSSDDSTSIKDSGSSIGNFREITFVQLEQVDVVDHDGYQDPVFGDQIISTTKLLLPPIAILTEEELDRLENSLDYVVPITYGEDYFLSGFYLDKENPHYSQRFELGMEITAHGTWYYGIFE